MIGAAAFLMLGIGLAWNDHVIQIKHGTHADPLIEERVATSQAPGGSLMPCCSSFNNPFVMSVSVNDTNQFLGSFLAVLPGSLSLFMDVPSIVESIPLDFPPPELDLLSTVEKRE